MGLIGIVDYGAGNLMSVTNALNFLGLSHRILRTPAELEEADKIILPGVGAFPACADALAASGFAAALKETEKPFLGICVGMQLLFELGLEMRETSGLGRIGGQVRKIKTDFKLPQIGWNSLSIKRPSPLLVGVRDGAYAYFVHSYCAEPVDPASVVAFTEYGEAIPAVVQNGRVFGCQFHPEKSGEAGLRILRNFGELQ